MGWFQMSYWLRADSGAGRALGHQEVIYRH
jgi:hypothetical protein